MPKWDVLSIRRNPQVPSFKEKSVCGKGKGNSKKEQPKPLSQGAYEDITSTETVQPFQFERLPPEIRREVYKLLLTPERDVVCRHTILCKLSKFSIVSPPIKKHTTRHTQILRVSKSIHDEATAILYGYSRFIFFPYYNEPFPVPTSLIEKLPQKYRDLIHDVTLKAFDREMIVMNRFIWVNILASDSKTALNTRQAMKVRNDLRCRDPDLWNALTFMPQTSFKIEPLFKCQNIRRLTVEMLPNIYLLAWGGGGRAYRLEDADGIKDLLRVRVRDELVLVDMANIPIHYPHLAVTKAKLHSCLTAQLLTAR